MKEIIDCTISKIFDELANSLAENKPKEIIIEFDDGKMFRLKDNEVEEFEEILVEVTCPF